MEAKERLGSAGTLMNEAATTAAHKDLSTSDSSNHEQDNFGKSSETSFKEKLIAKSSESPVEHIKTVDYVKLKVEMNNIVRTSVAPTAPINITLIRKKQAKIDIKRERKAAKTVNLFWPKFFFLRGFNLCYLFI